MVGALGARVRGERVETKAVDVVFDGPPNQPAPRFVEVEDMSGVGVRVGEWVERSDGHWALRLKVVVEE